jgi:predicted DNA-binding protein (UPF0251 family)
MDKRKTKLIEVKDAAKRMNISPQRLYAYLKAGKFESAKMINGTRWVVAEWEIDAFNEDLIDVSGTYVNWRKTI